MDTMKLCLTRKGIYSNFRFRFKQYLFAILYDKLY